MRKTIDQEHLTGERALFKHDNLIVKNAVFDSKNITATDFSLSGNYAFDGAEKIEIHHSKLISKDAFWNCQNVTVYDSIIIGEYLGWNSRNLRFVNCYIESEQGLCYVENLVIKNGRIVNTDLAFEYSTVDVSVSTTIDSVKNPISGSIKAKNIGELILEKTEVEPEKTIICLTSACGKMTDLVKQHA